MFHQRRKTRSEDHQAIRCHRLETLSIRFRRHIRILTGEKRRRCYSLRSSDPNIWPRINLLTCLGPGGVARGEWHNHLPRRAGAPNGCPSPWGGGHGDPNPSRRRQAGGTQQLKPQPQTAELPPSPGTWQAPILLPTARRGPVKCPLNSTRFASLALTPSCGLQGIMFPLPPAA